MAITNGALLNSVPAPQQQTLSTNYLDLAGTANEGWAQQYVPDLMEKEAEVFGPRTISGFLAQVGAEEAMTADQVVWSEQGRLHLSYTGSVVDLNGVQHGTGANSTTLIIESDIDGNAIDTTAGVTDHGIRVNDTIIVANSTEVQKCLVVAVRAAGGTAPEIDVSPYAVANLTNSSATRTSNGTTILVYGSEFAKGGSYQTSSTGACTSTATNTRGANEPSFLSFSNKPIIMKDYYEVSGSDASRIGWVEVASEMGASGYLWYLKAESDTRARLTDYVEMAM